VCWHVNQLICECLIKATWSTTTLGSNVVRSSINISIKIINQSILQSRLSINFSIKNIICECLIKATWSTTTLGSNVVRSSINISIKIINQQHQSIFQSRSSINILINIINQCFIESILYGMNLVQGMYSYEKDVWMG
jgi:riboflavin synthase alpha subunit